MADGEIYITITDAPVNGASPNSPQMPEAESVSTDKKDNKQLQQSYVKHQFFNFVSNQAQQLVSYSIGNIGNFTGNYQVQRNIQEMLRVGNMAKSIGTAVLAGSAFGVPGMLIAGSIAAASQVINLIYEDNTLAIQTKKQNREINMMRQISGLDGLTNGSRWGNQ